jgi:outer membrane lipoprotein SlyB
MKKASAQVAAMSKRAVIVAAMIATFGSMPFAAQAEQHRSKAKQSCPNCATVVSSHSYQREAESGSGLGVAGGAVVGGLLGNQVGSGNGRTLATIAGAVGGGYAGNRIERHVKARTVTDVRVRMNNGSVRTFTEEGPDHYRSGERVRVVQGRLVAR